MKGKIFSSLALLTAVFCDLTSASTGLSRAKVILIFVIHCKPCKVKFLTQLPILPTCIFVTLLTCQ